MISASLSVRLAGHGNGEGFFYALQSDAERGDNPNSQKKPRCAVRFHQTIGKEAERTHQHRGKGIT